MTTPMAIMIAWKIPPCHPEERNPEMIGGVVQGIMIPFVIGTIPIFITTQVTTILNIGTRMNGIAITGFKTIGSPKMMGSLIPKIPGNMDNLPSCLILDDLQKASIAIISDNVDPAPPYVAKRFWNC